MARTVGAVLSGSFIWVLAVESAGAGARLLGTFRLHDSADNRRLIAAARY